MKEDKTKLKIGILGFGNMGRAIFQLLERQPSLAKKTNFYVCSLGVGRVKRANYLQDKKDLFEKCDLVFLCVKPQEFYQMEFAKYLFDNDPIFISIMAGVKVGNIEKITGCRKIVRAMPNLPLQIGRGFTGWHADKKEFNRNEWKIVERMFSYFGKSLFVSREEKLDAITAISGSGPAYVFLFLDALIKSAVGLGFSKKQAEEMVTETVFGSTEYFLKNRGKTSLKELISMVKSKKGTTEAALNELNVDNFYKKWQSAVQKACARAKEISSYEIK
jgi:pyrroline-5-carboxylate reductase